MANKSLTDLTARTATADSDLLHINSGGTDYKEQKNYFLKGSFGIEFENTSLLTSQIDALTTARAWHYEGLIIGNGHQTETGLPEAQVFFVYADIYASTSKIIEIVRAGDPNIRYVCVKTSGGWGSWTQLPARSEITSLNNSLTNNSMTPMSVLSGRGTALDGGYCLVGNMVHINWKFKAGTSATNSPSISSTPPSPKTEAALSCIDITSGISSAIDGSVPCGVSSVGTLYLKEIVNNHIYAITGTYIKL